MLKFVALLVIICLGVYYYIDNTVSVDLIETYCKRQAQEQTEMLPLEALKIRDRASEYDFYEQCRSELDGLSILQILIKSLQGTENIPKKQFQ